MRWSVWPAAGVVVLLVVGGTGSVDARPKAPPPTPTPDPTRRLLEEYLDGAHRAERLWQLRFGPCMYGRCDCLAPLARFALWDGRIAAALESAQQTQDAYWCVFSAEKCVPADVPPSHRLSSTLYDQGVEYITPSLSCPSPSAEALRVASELNARMGRCDAARTIAPPPSTPAPARRSPKATAPPATPLAGDPSDAALAQLRRMDWVGNATAALNGLEDWDLGLAALNLARAELEQAVLERAFASEEDPWLACGGRPFEDPFVPLLPPGAAEATLKSAAAHLAIARDELGWNLGLRTEAVLHLEQGDCPAVAASLQRMRDPWVDWLRAQVDRRWPGGCPAATP